MLFSAFGGFTIYVPVLKIGQFAMPETCENWLGLVNSCVYNSRQTREIYQVLT